MATYRVNAQYRVNGRLYGRSMRVEATSAQLAGERAKIALEDEGHDTVVITGTHPA